MARDKSERRRLLIDSINRVNMTPEDFAARVLARDRSTVYRWLSGESPIPRSVEKFLTDHWRHRAK